MEIYRALSDYAASTAAVNVLSFCKGEQFEVLEEDKSHKEWWGARRIHDNAVGYVPAKYMKYHERRVGKLFTDSEREERDIHLKKLEEMQNQAENTFPGLYRQHPSHVRPYDDWENENIPQPDYSDEEDSGFIKQSIESKLKKVYENVPSGIVAFDDWDPGDRTNTRGEPLDIEIPEPDYDDQEITKNGTSPSAVNGNGRSQGLIEPRKLSNPCQESRERQDLHRELLMNTKMGVNILKKKPEFQRELERRRESQKKRDWELYKEQKKTLFEKKMEEQANKLKMQEEQQKTAEKAEQDKPEFLKMHDKIRSKSHS